jgi:caa(3)-type oxidase subunit IV
MDIGSDSHEAHGGSFATYMVVFAALTVFTAISFEVNRIYPPPHFQGAAIILGVAVVKAFLVALIFMHLKWDWSRLYFLIIPAFILGFVMIIVLMPDMVLSWDYYP